MHKSQETKCYKACPYKEIRKFREFFETWFLKIGIMGTINILTIFQEILEQNIIGVLIVVQQHQGS